MITCLGISFNPLHECSCVQIKKLITSVIVMSDPTISSCSEVNTEGNAFPLETTQAAKTKPEGVSKKQWKRQLRQKKFEESKPAWK